MSMSVQNNQINQSFKSQNNDFSQERKYENPVNRKLEYFTAVIPPAAGSALLGTAVGYVVSNLTKKKNVGLISGIATAIAAGALSITTALYKANIGAVIKEKQMDVFTRERSAATTIAEKLDEQASQDENLDNVVNNYAKFQVGNKGGAGLILNA